MRVPVSNVKLTVTVSAYCLEEKNQNKLGRFVKTKTVFDVWIFIGMGLLTILKKMKQKEKEMRLLMLYPFMCVLNHVLFILFSLSVDFGTSVDLW